MKRVLTAAVFSGLVLIIAPQVASADHGAQHSSADCAGQSEQARPEPDHRGPSGRGYYDRPQEHNDEDGEFLF